MIKIGKKEKVFALKNGISGVDLLLNYGFKKQYNIDTGDLEKCYKPTDKPNYWTQNLIDMQFIYHKDIDRWILTESITSDKSFKLFYKLLKANYIEEIKIIE